MTDAAQRVGVDDADLAAEGVRRAAAARVRRTAAESAQNAAAEDPQHTSADVAPELFGW